MYIFLTSSHTRNDEQPGKSGCKQENGLTHRQTGSKAKSATQQSSDIRLDLSPQSPERRLDLSPQSPERGPNPSPRLKKRARNENVSKNICGVLISTVELIFFKFVIKTTKNHVFAVHSLTF